MFKLSDIGIGQKVEVAQPPKCNCGSKDCSPVIVGSNFESKEEVIGMAMDICNEWDCPHTFFFIKFKYTCAIGLHECIESGETEEEDNYEWNVYKLKWEDIKKIRGYVAEFGEIHFAVVMEETKDGDFKIINK